MVESMPATHDVPAVDGEALLALLTQVSAFGGGADGAVTRLALGDADRSARDWLATLFRREGLKLVVDEIGNMFGVLDWAGPGAPTIMTGSHLDSQPNGGRFDGALGVVAACAAVGALRRRISASGSEPKANVIVVNWTNEEGARFQPSLLGSATYTGELGLALALSRTDGDGISVADALDAIGYRGSAAPAVPAAYIELHVEGSSKLEDAGRHVAAFTRYWGATKYKLAFHGRQSHTGPTPMADRRDALLAAAHLICDLKTIADRAGLDLHTSVGRLEVSPNSPNVVPAQATCFIELRSGSPERLAAAERDLLEAIERAAAAASVSSEIVSVDRRKAGVMDADLVALATEVAARLGHATLRLETIAGHDGVSMASVCPSLVIAVPSVGGIMHHPSEFTSHDDCLLGAQVLAGMLWHIVTTGTLSATEHRR